MTELYKAMSKAFAAIEGASKDSKNPHFKSSYADLSSVVQAIKPHLSANGLWFMQMNHDCDGGVCIETIVNHENGETLSFGKLFIPATKQDAQGYGSALSYARRYGLMTAFGVCPVDDDGNAASRPISKSELTIVVQEPITDEQFAELTTLGEQCEVDWKVFCKHYRIASVKVLPKDLFDHARKMLANKIKKQEAE